MSVAAVLRGTDNGDGAYTNPVLFADYPDPEIIRVDLEPIGSPEVC